MATLLKDLALIDDENSVGMTQCVEAMCDTDDRAAPGDSLQVGHHRRLGLVVQGAGGLVQQQNPWIGQQRPRQGYTLTLPA
ncbi:hypothetical protein D3C76_1767490 [compost metagenome]